MGCMHIIMHCKMLKANILFRLCNLHSSLRILHKIRNMTWWTSEDSSTNSHLKYRQSLTLIFFFRKFVNASAAIFFPYFSGLSFVSDVAVAPVQKPLIYTKSFSAIIPAASVFSYFSGTCKISSLLVIHIYF